jgi:hypothetical protein
MDLPPHANVQAGDVAHPTIRWSPRRGGGDNDDIGHDVVGQPHPGYGRGGHLLLPPRVRLSRLLLLVVGALLLVVGAFLLHAEEASAHLLLVAHLLLAVLLAVLAVVLLVVVRDRTKRRLKFKRK